MNYNIWFCFKPNGSKWQDITYTFIDAVQCFLAFKLLKELPHPFKGLKIMRL